MPSRLLFKALICVKTCSRESPIWPTRSALLASKGLNWLWTESVLDAAAITLTPEHQRQYNVPRYHTVLSIVLLVGLVVNTPSDALGSQSHTSSLWTSSRSCYLLCLPHSRIHYYMKDRSHSYLEAADSAEYSSREVSGVSTRPHYCLQPEACQAKRGYGIGACQNHFGSSAMYS